MDEHVVQAAARFDDWADTYDEGRISPWFRFYQSLALSKFDIEGGEGFFLEVGCGTGWAVREVSRRIKSGFCCGIDVSSKMIANARTRTFDLQNIFFQVANADSIPYADETFSSILCTNSFHHYLNPVKALREIRRVLKKDGKFVLLDSARDVFFPIRLQDFLRRYIERGHVRYYTTKEMRSMLKAAQWNVRGDVLSIRRFLDHGKTFTGLMCVECVK